VQRLLNNKSKDRVSFRKKYGILSSHIREVLVPAAAPPRRLPCLLQLRPCSMKMRNVTSSAKELIFLFYTFMLVVLMHSVVDLGGSGKPEQ